MPCINHIDVREGLNRCARCQRFFCQNCVVQLKGEWLCAGCKTEQVKDIQSGVDATVLPLAGIGRRFVAQFVDGLAMGVVILPVMFAFGFFAVQGGPQALEGPAGVGVQVIVQIFFFGLGLAYEGFMLMWRGQTLGKMALGIKVVSPDGGDISAGQAWIRPLVRSLLGACWLIDYIPAFFRKDKCTVHDMAARTRVVKLS